MNEQLSHQLYFLKTSLSLYETNEAEAKRLATTLRVVFHDTKHSFSLAEQLGIKSSIQFLEPKVPIDAFAYWELSGPMTLDIIADNFIPQSPYTGLVAKRIVVDETVVSVKFLPLFLNPQYNDNHRKVGFESWWDSIIFDDKHGIKLKRCDAVLMVANKDGGAHVDPNIPKEYLDFKNRSLLPIDYNGQPLEFDTIPIYAAIAQIAHEAIEAIESFFA